MPTVRVDANGGWSVEEAVAAADALTADGPLEYLEQPCETVPELAELRRRVDVPIAADESIRKADDPLHVVRVGAADVAVLKVAPLGGVAPDAGHRRADRDPDRGVQRAGFGRRHRGRTAGRRRLPELRHACGLGTGGLFVEDVAEPVAAGRRLSARVRTGDAGPGAARRAAAAEPRAQAVVDRAALRACFPLLS